MAQLTSRTLPRGGPACVVVAPPPGVAEEAPPQAARMSSQAAAEEARRVGNVTGRRVARAPNRAGMANLYDVRLGGQCDGVSAGFLADGVVVF